MREITYNLEGAQKAIDRIFGEPVTLTGSEQSLHWCSANVKILMIEDFDAAIKLTFSAYWEFTRGQFDVIYTKRYTNEEILKTISESTCKVILINRFLGKEHNAFKLVEEIKERFPEKLIIGYARYNPHIEDFKNSCGITVLKQDDIHPFNQIKQLRGLLLNKGLIE